MELGRFQEQITSLYGDRDRRRGVEGTFRRLVEEIGELARALRTRDGRALEEEIGDVLAWTVSVAAMVGVNADQAVEPYREGCPKCGRSPCVCAEEVRVTR
jgi:NTP pyrophosphatase (non-canonical NTP hydrolase)